ncbi:LysR family transcriptional regulator [Consotaella aegiceratis]|uniref:LysR family transcriptional regulator n=1 Tax=Consotaella aegiceratis TaxID=3097961 RepID=UPI002F42E469
MGLVMRELRQFVEVANRRSISRAAERLNISQPALSRAIRQLEHSYGVPLFVRTGAGVVLSPYGTALYGRAVRALRALEEAREEISLLQGSAKVTLNIAAGDLWGLVILPNVINRFAETHADVLVRLDVIEDRTRYEGLRNGIYDIVFGTPLPNYEAMAPMQFEPLVRQGTYVYCDATHPLASQPDPGPNDYARFSWVSHGFVEETRASHGDTQRDYAVRADTMMHALVLMRGSRLLTSASSGFAPLFRQFGVVSIGVDEAAGVVLSGPAYPDNQIERTAMRDFLSLTRQQVEQLALPDWPAGRTPSEHRS